MHGHVKDVREAGSSWDDAEKVIVMLHGRGAPAEDILGLSTHLNSGKIRFVAPQATGHTWYPYSFLAPVEQNEPWLSSALSLLEDIESGIKARGFASDQIYWLGFSQGACLASEYAARNAQQYGGVVALTGGLIGDKIDAERYGGDFNKTPVFLANSDQDPHIPVERSRESEQVFKQLNAETTLKIYPGMGHTIVEEEIKIINEKILN